MAKAKTTTTSTIKSMRDFGKEIRMNKDFGYDVQSFMFHTNNQVFNYLNSQVEYIKGKEQFNIGLEAGKSVLILGKAGSGKSTFGISMCWDIMKKYEDSTMFLFDFEQSHQAARIKSITGMTDEEYDERIIMKKVDIYTETVLKTIIQISEFKKQNREALLVDNQEGVLDEDGKPVKVLPPTFVFIDSLASMKTKEGLEGEDLSGLTAGGRNAIKNRDFFNRIVQPCAVGNIIVVIINHISQNMSMGVTPPEANTRFLKNTEAVTGGSAVLYMANLILKIEAKDKLDPDKPATNPYHIRGFKSTITVVKSRNTEGGKTAPFIFNQVEGIDPDLSALEYLKSEKVIASTASMCIPTRPDVKFSSANFKNKLNADPEFKKDFYLFLEEVLKSAVSISSHISKNVEEEVEEVVQEIPADEALYDNSESEEASVLTEEALYE